MGFKTWLEYLQNYEYRKRKDWERYNERPWLHMPEDLWYHGTQSDFDSFRVGGIKRQTKDWNAMLGVHFSATPTIAQMFAGGLYSDKKSGRVITARLNLSNVKDYKSEGDIADDAVQMCIDQGILTPDNIGAILRWKPDIRNTVTQLKQGKKWHDWAYHDGLDVLKSAGTKRRPIARAFVQHLQQQGHDGLSYPNIVEGGLYTPCIVVFDPSKIDIVKSEPHAAE